MSLPISIIVPIYQSEQTLRKCLESILSQTFREFEVLLVNDGSTDRCAEICGEYVKKDSRVRFIEKSHSGVSDTRQMGLENATGEYVIHCDSDDWMEPTMLEKLYEKAIESGVDMVVCDFWEEFHSKSQVNKQFPHEYDASSPIARQISQLSNSMWNKLIRRSLFFVYGVSFPKGAKYGEDMFVTMSLLNKGIKIAYVEEPLYHYKQWGVDSLTHRLTSDFVTSNLSIISELEYIISDDLKEKLAANKIFVLFSIYENKLLPKKQLSKLFPEVHKDIVKLSFRNYRFFLLSLVLYGIL